MDAVIQSLETCAASAAREVEQQAVVEHRDQGRRRRGEHALAEEVVRGRVAHFELPEVVPSCEARYADCDWSPERAVSIAA